MDNPRIPQESGDCPILRDNRAVMSPEPPYRMVDVLNPEHTESKTLNTTLEVNEIATVETQTEAPESNHNLSASAETQHVLPAEALEHAENSTENHAQPDAAIPHPTEDISHEEEMDFGALLESFEHEQAAQEAAQAVDGNVVTGTVI